MYSPISAPTTNLKIIRKGWFRSSFELTDGKAVYGQLNYFGIFRRKASVKTASSTWIFQHKIFSRTILITDENGLAVGESSLKWFSRKAVLRLANGGLFTFSRQTFWKRQYFWLDEKQQQVVSIRPHFFLRTMDVILDKDLQSGTLPLLLAFLGTHLIVLNRRRKAAAAAH